MKKLLFILPALPDYMPYISNYLSIAEECSKDYDLICWNRKGDDLAFPDNYIVYQRPTKDSFSPIRKIIEIYKFYRFTIRRLRNKCYSFVFTYTIADSAFFSSFLCRHYLGRFVFDIRDYSPLINSFFFKRQIYRLLRYSALNVISSEGFKRWLPDGFDYQVCHNISLNCIDSPSYERTDIANKSITKVLTIGLLRNSETNISVIDSLANIKGIHLVFAGDGNGVPVLKQHCQSNSVRNVEFLGRYKKEEEDGIVRSCDMINIALPHTVNSDSCMGNRFYLSARLRKPMIVSSNSYQADIVDKYGLGLIVSRIDTLYDDIIWYLSNFNAERYERNCHLFLEDVRLDMNCFKGKIVRLLCSE